MSMYVHVYKKKRENTRILRKKYKKKRIKLDETEGINLTDKLTDNLSNNLTDNHTDNLTNNITVHDSDNILIQYNNIHYTQQHQQHIHEQEQPAPSHTTTITNVPSPPIIQSTCTRI